MKNLNFFFFFLFCASISLFAQENEPQERITYSNITEFGVVAASPRSVVFEAVTVHGFALNKKHHFGFGIGIGGNYHTQYYDGVAAHMPLFLNYRLYFKPEKTFSPHFNTALGGVILKDGVGAYSSITMGFRAGKFSFSSGLSFLAIQREEERYDYWGYDLDGNYVGYSVLDKKSKWYFPIGITLKWGFAF